MPEGGTAMGNSPVSTPKTSPASCSHSPLKTSLEIEPLPNPTIGAAVASSGDLPENGGVDSEPVSDTLPPQLSTPFNPPAKEPSLNITSENAVVQETTETATESLSSEQPAVNSTIPKSQQAATGSVKKSGYTKKPAKKKAKAAPRCGKSRTAHSSSPASATAATASSKDGALDRQAAATASLAATRRRPSNSKGGKKNRTPALCSVEDPAPRRLVNPLVDLPNDGALLAGDLWQLLDVTFPIPDTFSVAYLARVLGYRAPTVVPPHRAYTPVPFVRGSLEHVHDAAYAVPALGPKILTPHGDSGRDRDCLSPDLRDPFYAVLLESESDDFMAPVTAAQLAKLNSVLTPADLAGPSPLQSTLDMAAELGLLQDHQVSTWHESKDKAGAAGKMIKEGMAAPGTAGDGGAGSWCGVALWRGDDAVAQAAYTFAWHPCGLQKYELVLVLYNLQTTTVSLLEPGLVEPQDEVYMIALMACVLEHARLCHVHYAVVPQAGCLQTYFRMTSSNGRLICDLHNCSSKYAFLRYREQKLQQEASSTVTAPTQPTLVQRRWLAQLPTAQEMMQSKSLLDSKVTTDSVCTVNTGQVSEDAPVPKLGRKRSSASISPIGPCTVSAQSVTVSLQTHIQSDGSICVVSSLNSSAADQFQTDSLQLDLLRQFEVRQAPLDGNCDTTDDDSEVLQQLQHHQQSLLAHETMMRSCIHRLMGKVIEERSVFEHQARSRQEERNVLEQYRRTLDRRKELDLAWQKQLEQDMDAVCDVCADGEVTPDNQILFCEACNVAVHQMCYGIDRIPEGDYYCIACRCLGRNLTTASSRANQHGEFVAHSAFKVLASPLPICCELCPRKQGAFLRTDVKNLSDEERTYGKWVHAVCAKWLGLDYVSVPDVVEDVTEWKHSFRRMGIKCDLCQGERGCMNKCSDDGCAKWLHVTCARAVRTCEVIHGEDVRGAVTLNPWSLKCPEHSSSKTDDIVKDATSIETLIQSAKEFPPEPPPPPLSVVWKPFNTATGVERSHLLRDKSYERSLLVELTMKKVFGVRCEVCDQEIDPKLRMRCHMCSVIFCKDCSLAEVDGVDNFGNFKCAACVYVASKEKAGEEYETPRCLVCYQKSGWLRKAVAKPFVGKKRARRASYDSTYFGRQLWVHSVCTFWNPKLSLDVETGVVECSNVVMNTGRSLINSSTQCFLCGNNGGLKVRCSHENCAYIINGKRMEAVFHVTCARMAGLEVNASDEGSKLNFYVKCYRHGGNEFNLRAKMEDLIEIEKRRSGKLFARSDAAMTFAHASRLLHAAIAVLRVLGWAWQWAEQWVDYNSSWEPLLEPGEREEEMTKEELKIVDSTRESRCADARTCRLSALGAALRNRSFDTENDFDRESLDRAFLALLQTPSLVGPLQDFEIDFFRHWLGLAYCSKSRYLGFGDDKIVVNESSDFCLHAKDRSPKFLLHVRTLPGTPSEADDAGEVDNFLLTEVVTDEILESFKRSFTSPGRTAERATVSSSRTRSSRKELPTTDGGLLSSRKIMEPDYVSVELSIDTPSPPLNTSASNSPRKRMAEELQLPETESAPKRRTDRRKVDVADVQDVVEESDHDSSLPSKLDLVTTQQTSSKKRTRSSPRHFRDDDERERLPKPIEGGTDPNSETIQSTSVRQQETTDDQHSPPKKRSGDGTSVSAIEERSRKRRGRPPKKALAATIDQATSEPDTLPLQVAELSRSRYDKDAVRLARRPPYLRSKEGADDEKINEGPPQDPQILNVKEPNQTRRPGRPARNHRDRKPTLTAGPLEPLGSTKQFIRSRTSEDKSPVCEGEAIAIASVGKSSDDSHVALSSGSTIMEPDSAKNPPAERQLKNNRPREPHKQDRSAAHVAQASNPPASPSSLKVDPAPPAIELKRRRGRPPKSRAQALQSNSVTNEDQHSEAPPPRRSSRNREVAALEVGSAAMTVDKRRGRVLDSEVERVETVDETREEVRKNPVASTRANEAAASTALVVNLADPGTSAPPEVEITKEPPAGRRLLDDGSAKMQLQHAEEPEESSQPKELLQQQPRDIGTVSEQSLSLQDGVISEAPTVA